MRVNPDEVFAKVEEERMSGELAANVTTATVRYYASMHEGYIEQVNTKTGEHRLGTFSNGVFIPMNRDIK